MLPSLKKEMEPKMKEFKKEYVDKLFLLLDYEKCDIVEWSAFEAVMKPWSAFTACDINNDDELDVSEMHKLLWLSEGERPLISRVEKEMVAIDKDGGGTIDRIEWMMYLVVPVEGSGLQQFDLKLRGLFDKFDADGNKRIDNEEMADFLSSFYEDRYCLLSVEDQIFLKEDYFTKKAHLIMSEMTFGKSGIDRYSVEWSDFKFVKQKFKHVFDEMEAHIEKLVKEHLHRQRVQEYEY